jgi:nicotinamide-nucleotide adenylyltransferase
MLIIGRFQPFHAGHLGLIQRYYRAGFTIKIAIGSTQERFTEKNPLTCMERERKIKWVMKEFNIKRYKIYHVPDIKDDSRYVKHVLNIVGSFNTIVTGNPQVLKLFRDYKAERPWNIESFEESNRPAGNNISASKIRRRWLGGSDKTGLLRSTFNYLKSLGFSERLRSIHS